MKLTSDLLSLSPLGHSDGFASCKAWRVLISASLPKTPFPRRRAVYAWLALHLCNRGRLLSVRPAPTLFDHLYASLHRAFGHTRPASMPGLSVGLPPLVPVGGYAPQPNFLITIEVFRQSAIYLYKSIKPLLTVTHKSEMLIRKLSRTSASGCS